MLKKILFTTFLSLGLALIAVQSAYAGQMAAVDFRYIIAESDEMKRALAEVETMKTAMEKELGELEQALESASESLKRKRTVLSQEQLMEEETALKAQLREYRLKGENMNEKLSNEVTIRRKRVIRGLEEVVNKIAEENGYEVVLDSSTLLFAAEGVEITETVLSRLNDHFENN